LFVNSSGQVGVGLTTPASRFHIFDSVAILTIEGSSTSSASLQFKTNSNNRYKIATPDSSADLAFYAGGTTEYMRLTSAGLLGLGTSSPVTALQVVGTGTFGNGVGGRLQVTTDSNLGYIDSLNNTSTQWQPLIERGTEIQFHTNTAGTTPVEKVRIDSSGRVGIGTSSPAAKLHVETIPASPSQSGSVIFGPNVNYGFEIRNVIDGGGFPSVEFRGPLAGSAPMVFYAGVGSAERMRIDGAGRVGIGTSTPATALEVLGFIQTQSGAFGGGGYNIKYNASNAASRSWQLLTDTTAYGDFAIQQSTTQTGSTYTPRFYISAAGNVGIGTTSPTFNLDVSGGAGNGIRYLNTTNSIGVIIGSDSTSAQVGSVSSHPVQFLVGAVERARIDTSGRLLVGTSTTSANTTILFQGTSANANDGAAIRLAAGAATPADGTNLGYIFFSDSSHSQSAAIQAQRDGGTWTSGSSQPSRLVFSTTADGAASPTERMRINSTGQILINSTSSLSGAPFINVVFSAATNSAFCSNDTSSGSGSQHFRFFSGGTQVGNINTTTTATAYATSSDYRLKENVVQISNSITRLQQLKPSRFNFIIEPDKIVDGFIAHEAQAVVPECVTGTKDEVDADGNPLYQGIDQSKLVPLLTAALQEAVARIESLEADVAALKGA
jgi:hypothetical protein